jgi:hypothetical protein
MRYGKGSDQKQAGDDLAVAVEAGCCIAGLIEAMKLRLVVVASNTVAPAAVGSSHGQKVVPDLEEIQPVGERVEGVVVLDCSSTETPSISWMAARQQMCEAHNHQPFHAYHHGMVHGELVVLGRSSTDEEVVSTSAVAVAMVEVHKYGSQTHSSGYSCEAVQSTRSVDVESVDWGEHKCVAEEAVAEMVAERPSAATFVVEVVWMAENIEKMSVVVAGSVIGAKKTPKHR